jgi:hypothetical protein
MLSSRKMGSRYIIGVFFRVVTVFLSFLTLGNHSRSPVISHSRIRQRHQLRYLTVFRSVEG